MILPGYGPLNAPACRRHAGAEIGQEQALAGENLALQPAEDAAGHARVHLDAVGHERHRPRFGADLVARAHRQDDGLHVVADDFACDHHQIGDFGLRIADWRPRFPLTNPQSAVQNPQYWSGLL